MRITRQAVTALHTCAICERTLLVGERAVRYSPDGEGFVDVCALCHETALQHGWTHTRRPVLVGEVAVRASADGEGFVGVCALCQETALEHGWIKEGSPTSPVVAE